MFLTLNHICLNKPNQMSARQRVTLELADKTETHERRILVTQVQMV